MILVGKVSRILDVLAIASRNACAAQVTLEEELTPVEVIAEDRWSVTGIESGT